MEHNYAQPAAGKWPKDKDHSVAGPVKAACLSCRQKKAKCDGAKPVCGQVRVPSYVPRTTTRLPRHSVA